MNAYEAALIGLVASVIGFYFIAQKFGGKPTNVQEFFHDPSVPRNAFSVVAANLGFGQGILLILMATQAYGLLFLLIPVMAFAGQRAYSFFVSKIAPESLFSRGMLVAGLGDALDRTAGKKVYFQQWTTVFVIAAYIMAIAYEILVSAHWLSTALFPHPSVPEKAAISLLLFGVVLSYTITGGYKTVQRTDFIQVMCGSLLLFGVVFLLLHPGLAPGMIKGTQVGPSHAFPTDLITLLSFATLALAPFNSQFWGILNQAAASHQRTSHDRRKLFNWSSAITLALYIALSCAALYFNLTKGGADISLEALLTSSAKQASGWSVLWVAFCAVGLGAVIMSTADTLMIVVTQCIHEGFSKGLSGSSSQEAGTSGDLKKVRVTMLLVFPPIFLILIPLWFTEPDAFGLLFAVAAPCEVLAPLFALLMILARNNRLDAVTVPLVGKLSMLHFYFVLSGITLVAAIVTTLSKWQFARSIGFAGFVVSVLISWAILKKTSRSVAS